MNVDHMPRIISVSGGKGGVGKTVIAANLSKVISTRSTKKVLLVDADMFLSGLDVLLNIRPKLCIQDFFQGNVPIEEIIIDTNRGFDLLPGGSGVTEAQDLSVDQRQRLVYSLEEMSHRYGTIVIDCPPGLHKDALQLCAISHTTVLCVTPEPTSITDAYAFIKVMNETYREPRFVVLMNMVTSEIEAQRIFNQLLGVCSDFLGVSLEYAGYIPTDIRVRNSVRKQDLFVESAFGTLPERCMGTVTDRITQFTPTEESWSGGLKALWPIFLQASAS